MTEDELKCPWVKQGVENVTRTVNYSKIKTVVDPSAQRGLSISWNGLELPGCSAKLSGEAVSGELVLVTGKKDQRRALLELLATSGQDVSVQGKPMEVKERRSYVTLATGEESLLDC